MSNKRLLQSILSSGESVLESIECVSKQIILNDSNKRIKSSKPTELTTCKSSKSISVSVKFISPGLYRATSIEVNNTIEKKSSFKNHADNHVSSQLNRIQNLIVTQSDSVDSSQVTNHEAKEIPWNSLSRSTVFIAQSHIYPQIFQIYYNLFIDDSVNATGCPAFMVKLNLNEFNRRWAMFRHILLEDNLLSTCNSYARVTERITINKWIEQVKEVIMSKKNKPNDVEDRMNKNKIDNNESDMDEIDNNETDNDKNSFAAIILRSTPSEYFYLLSQPLNGDIILFQPGTIHSVFDATDSEIIRMKISSELVQSTTTASSELDITAGSYSIVARNFELKHLDRVTNNVPLDPRLVQIKELPIGEMTALTTQLKEMGIVIIRGVLSKEYAAVILKKSCAYLQELQGLQAERCELNLLDPKHAAAIHSKTQRELLGINNKSIRRQEANSRSTHMPSGHGITKYGAKSAVLQQLFTQALDPVWKSLYKLCFNADVYSCNAFCLHYQTPLCK